MKNNNHKKNKTKKNPLNAILAQSITVYFFWQKFSTNRFTVMVEAFVPCGGFVWLQRGKNNSQSIKCH